MLFILMRRNLIARSPRRSSRARRRKLGLERSIPEVPPRGVTNSLRFRRFSVRVEAAGWPAGRRSAQSFASPLFRDVPLHSRRPGPSRSLSAGLAPFSSLVALPCCLAAEHGNGLRRPRLPSGRTVSARASPRFLSLRLASPRLVSRARDLGAWASRISLWLSF